MGSPPNRELAFFLSPPHDCGYFEGRQAISLFADPREPVHPETYSRLIEFGFRRSGGHVYRPRCEGCSACTSLRIPVADFKPHRWQRRVSRANADLEMQVVPPDYSDEHYTLYRQYLEHRHAGSGMDQDDPEAYARFLTGDSCHTRFMTFREHGRLVAVAVVDRVDHGLSAVYTFFDPKPRGRSLGTYAILRQIQWAAQLGLPYVYLGYWIEGNRKMDYKARFLPHEIFQGGRWIARSD
ncbi:MAG: arginyltransferase [Gammaproteobacteria bacterium]